MPSTVRFFHSLLSGAPALGFWDWNPTEGSGTVITDKNGSGVDLTTNGVWVASGQIRYDRLGLNNFRYSRVVNALLSMAQSSAMVYVNTPALWTVGGYFMGHQPITSGHINDRKLYVTAVPGFLKVTITQASDLADKTVIGTTSIGTSTEFCAGWTHDGATLRLYVNGVEEGNIACGPAGTGTPAAFQVAGGEPAISDKEPPSNGGLFGSTGAIFGRAIAAGRAFSPAEIATRYAEFQTQYPGLP